MGEGDRGLMGCWGGSGICWGVPSSRLGPVWQAHFFSPSFWESEKQERIRYFLQETADEIGSPFCFLSHAERAAEIEKSSTNTRNRIQSTTKGVS